jgi:hypothetical protein
MTPPEHAVKQKRTADQPQTSEHESGSSKADRVLPNSVVDHGLSRPTSKQQGWEQEFQRDYPGLKDVGGGGDPWSGADEGVMTNTGVRVPIVAGRTLLRRPFYERKMAAFFAYQGFIHYAELIEAGHDSAAVTLAQALYAKTGHQVPRDTELNLDSYTKWSRRAVASRQGLELGMIVAGLVMTVSELIALARTPTPPVPSTAPAEPAAPSPATPASGEAVPASPAQATVRVQITERAESIVAQSNMAVDQAVRSGDTAFFRNLGMSESQIRKVLNPRHRLFKAEYGNAVEAAAARGFAQDPLLSGSVRHIGHQRGHVAGTGKPDFVINEQVWGFRQFFDVTTGTQRAVHVLRDYGKRVMQLTYNIGVFP